MQLFKVVFSFLVLHAPLSWVRPPHEQEGSVPSASSSIPIIDISALTAQNADREAKIEIAKKIGRACEEIGFFAIINHGVPRDVISAAWNDTRDFFDLPLREKMTVTPDGFEYPYGYENTESLSRGKAKKENGHASETTSAPDLKETFSLGPKDPSKSGMPHRRLPPKPTSMQKSHEDYYKAMEHLAMKLLDAFAIALELEDCWFEDKMDRHMCALRTLNYPELHGM